MMVKVNVVVVPPPGAGFETATVAVPAVGISVAGTAASRLPLLT